MKYLLIPLLCLLACSKITLQSGFSKTKNETAADNIVFNGIIFFTSALLFFPFIIKNGITLSTLLYGITAGCMSVIYQYFYICAFKAGKMALTVIINNFSMLIPTLFSLFFYNEGFGKFKIIGIGLILISLCLNVSKSKEIKGYEKTNHIKWLIFTMLVFLFNGFIAINQKMYSAAEGLQIFEYVCVTNITAAAICAFLTGIISAKTKTNGLKKPPETLFTAFLTGAVLALFQALNTYSLSVIDGSILFPVYNCANSIILSIIGSTFFKEKLSKKQYAGAAIGIIAIVFMCI